MTNPSTTAWLRNSILGSLVIIGAVNVSSAQYGAPVNGFPSWQEQALLVLTNACRIAPQSYRDLYLPSKSILLPSNYPAVTPLYWSHELNQASRAHTIDMANNCGLSHNSCDGTDTFVRLKSYLKGSSAMGENIAYGMGTPQGTLEQWLVDNVSGGPAADKSSGDGHRRNIMSGSYNLVGMGYALKGTAGSRQTPFWTQDFAKATNANSAWPITSASHLFLTSGKTSFWINYNSATQQNITSCELVLASNRIKMNLHLGKPSSGIWAYEAAIGTTCRQYFFEVTDSQNKKWRYPESGAFLTYGEGSCKELYTGTIGIGRAKTRILKTNHTHKNWNLKGQVSRLHQKQ